MKVYNMINMALVVIFVWCELDILKERTLI